MTFQPFQPGDEAGIEAVIARVVAEYPEQVYPPDRKPLSEVAAQPDRQYWVCKNDNAVIGSVGMWLLKNNNCVLKSMFLDAQVRGKGLAEQLLNTATAWAIQHGALRMYLGTMIQFKAAQRFYEKLGFDKIEEEQLPADFPANPVDKVFYTKTLT